jgi:hypothetical protein
MRWRKILYPARNWLITWLSSLHRLWHYSLDMGKLQTNNYNKYNNNNYSMHTLRNLSILFSHCYYLVFVFTMTWQPPVGQGLHIIEDSWSHSDIPQSVGLLWKSDQPDAETCTWLHATLTRDRNPCPDGIRTHNSSKRAAADPRLRSRGHWDRRNCLVMNLNYEGIRIFNCDLPRLWVRNSFNLTLCSEMPEQLHTSGIKSFRSLSNQPIILGLRSSGMSHSVSL